MINTKLNLNLKAKISKKEPTRKKRPEDVFELPERKLSTNELKGLPLTKKERYLRKSLEKKFTL